MENGVREATSLANGTPTMACDAAWQPAAPHGAPAGVAAITRNDCGVEKPRLPRKAWQF